MARIGRLLGFGWLCLCAGLLVDAAVFCARAAAGDLHGLDFIAPYSAAGIILRDGPGRAYDLAAQEAAQRALSASWGGQPFLPALTPPPFLLAQAWLALFAPGPAYALWLAVNAACLAGGLLLLSAAAGLGTRGRLVALLAGLGSVPAVVELWQGQVASLALLGLGLAAWLGERRPEGAGAALALTLVKPQTAVGIVARPLAQTRWRHVLGLALGAAALAALSILVLGLPACLEYVRLLTHFAGETGAADTEQRYALSVRSGLAAAGLPPALQIATLGVLMLAGLGAIRLRPGPHWRDLALAVMLSLLLAPHLTSSDLLLLATVAIPLGAHLWRTGEASGWAVLGLLAAAWTAAPYLAWPVPLAELVTAVYLWLHLAGSPEVSEQRRVG